MKVVFFSVLIALSVCTSGHADLVLNDPGVAQTVDFTGFTGTGFSPTPVAGQLDSDDWAITGFSDGSLAFGGTQTAGDFARGISTGGVAIGGVYAFNVGGGNTALGFQPIAADFTPGNLTLRVSNGTGQTLDQIDIGYDVSVFNDEGRSNSFNFSYSTDNLTYTAISALDLVSPEAAEAAGAASWVTTGRSTSLAGLNISSGSQFFLRWTGDDVSGSDSRDEFALDNIRVTGFSAIPEPSSLMLVGLGLYAPMLRRRR